MNVEEKLKDLRDCYISMVNELKDSLGLDMPSVESAKITKIAFYESFMEDIDEILQ